MNVDKPGKGSLLVVFLTVFIDLLGFGIVLPLLPVYAREFVDDPTGITLGLLMASFSAMQFIFAPIWGRISDRIGRRPVIMIGLLGSVVFYTLFGLATVWKSIAWLFVARIGAGVSGATIATAQAYIADTTTLADRPKGMALIGMAFGLGFTFGPLIGFLAVPSGVGDPGPGPGYAAAGLSAIALLLAFFRLPESRSDTSAEAQTRLAGFGTLPSVLRMPSIAALLLTTFVCVFSFANFETTLSLVIKGAGQDTVQPAGSDPPGIPGSATTPFLFSFRQVCLTYAFIGFVLALVQGGLVRRLAGKASEVSMAAGGILCQIAGFVTMVLAMRQGATSVLFVALTLVTVGFAFLSPSIHSLISRRSDPARQGQVLGVNQSVNSLARIIGAGLSIPLLATSMYAPFVTAAALMTLGLALVVWSGRVGADYDATKSSPQPGN